MEFDSGLTLEEALRGTAAPPEIASQQCLLCIRYSNFKGEPRFGQIVVNQLVRAEVESIFQVIWDTRFPLHSVIPVSEFAWSDDASMEANNCSGFNYRVAVGKTKLSMHSYGLAVDLNPVQNPYLKGEIVLPPGAEYRPGFPGTLEESHPVVRAFLDFGWTWGGHWQTLKDWHHFEKPLA